MKQKVIRSRKMTFIESCRYSTGQADVPLPLKSRGNDKRMEINTCHGIVIVQLLKLITGVRHAGYFTLINMVLLTLCCVKITSFYLPINNIGTIPLSR